MERVTKFRSKYACSDRVLFYDYTPEECGAVRTGQKVDVEPKEGFILAVTFDFSNDAIYCIQDDDGYLSEMNVSEEHIIKIIEE